MATTQLLKWMQSKWIQNETTDLKPIGHGNYGSVYSFYDQKTKLRKALKVIEYEKVKAEMKIEIDVDDWLKEAKPEILHLKTLGDCKHILKLEDHHLDNEYNCIFLVTELAKKSLSQHIVDSNNELPPAEIVKIIHSVLSGIQFAHKRGIAHRNIKPENILITESGSYLLCDWGIAKKMRDYGTQTHNTGVKGTSNYLPPEVYNDLEKVNDKANLFKLDVYSAGLVFLVCCGFPPKNLEFIDKIDEDEHNSKHSEYIEKYVVPKIPEIKELMINLTQFDPKKRFDIDQTMSWCASSKVFSQFNASPVKAEEIHLDDRKQIVI